MQGLPWEGHSLKQYLAFAQIAFKTYKRTLGILFPENLDLVDPQAPRRCVNCTYKPAVRWGLPLA